MVIEALVSLLVLVGSAFVLIGSIGLVRLPDFYTRLHAPTKATTLGVGSLVLASALWLSDDGSTLSELLIAAFLFMTSPVSAHLLAKAALHRRTRSVCELPPAEHEVP
jgi:multicomponent K+:H+ antiporter subunit G